MHLIVRTSTAKLIGIYVYLMRFGYHSVREGEGGGEKQTMQRKNKERN